MILVEELEAYTVIQIRNTLHKRERELSENGAQVRLVQWDRSPTNGLLIEVTWQIRKKRVSTAIKMEAALDNIEAEWDLPA